LNRVTPLRRDPAAIWLSSSGRFAVTLSWVVVWFVFVPMLFAIAHFVDAALYVPGFDASNYGFTPGVLVALFTFVVLLAPVRALALSLRVGGTIKRVQEGAEQIARPLDDLSALDAEGDGTIVSLVGWVRGHRYLLHRAGGEHAVGLALPCRGQHLLETMHNFDLLDEAGGEALVVAAGARLLGRPNLQLSRAAEEDRNLVHSLDMPAGVAPTSWNAYVLRDGDPVMVIGVKSIVQDTSQLERGRSPQRTAVTSDGARPLLVIPLAAERREG
jgi:hypothetical protein